MSKKRKRRRLGIDVTYVWWKATEEKQKQKIMKKDSLKES